MMGMAYLQPADYPKFGLPPGTSADWVTAATALINSHCRRPDLNIKEYIESLRVTGGSHAIRLTYLPLAALGSAASPIIKILGKYAGQRRGEYSIDPLYEIACTFNLPGQWSALDTDAVDVELSTGELSWSSNLFGLSFSELKVTYTAGLSAIGDDVKAACAQIVRNAQATPALNASRTRIDTMQMDYFSSSLLDETVRAWLRPYVANRVG